MAEISPALALKCHDCDYRPPADSTMEEFDLHSRLEHGGADLHMDLVPICTCDSVMTFVETTGGPIEYVDHFVCPADFNRGVVKRGASRD